MILYVLSFVVLVAPLAVIALLTSRLSTRIKIVAIAGVALILLVLPIAAFWLFGGSSGLGG